MFCNIRDFLLFVYFLSGIFFFEVYFQFTCACLYLVRTIVDIIYFYRTRFERFLNTSPRIFSVDRFKSYSLGWRPFFIAHEIETKLKLKLLDDKFAQSQHLVASYCYSEKYERIPNSFESWAQFMNAPSTINIQVIFIDILRKHVTNGSKGQQFDWAMEYPRITEENKSRVQRLMQK